MADKAYTSGNWLVSEGREDEFVQAWTEFVQWARDNASGAGEFTLVRQENKPRHFLSLGSWDSRDSAEAWQRMPEFSELLGRARALCDEFDSGVYALAAQVT